LSDNGEKTKLQVCGVDDRRGLSEGNENKRMKGTAEAEEEVFVFLGERERDKKSNT